MSDEGTPEPIHTLVDNVTLLSVGYLELAAAQRTATVEGVEVSEEATPTYSMDFNGRPDDKRFRIGLRTEIQFNRGTVTAHVAVEYELTELLLSSIDQATRIEFMNTVALMTIVPFTRQAIADITQRVFGAALLMPIINQGELNFTMSDDADA